MSLHLLDYYVVIILISSVLVSFPSNFFFYFVCVEESYGQPKFVEQQKLWIPKGSSSTSRLVLDPETESATRFVNAPIEYQGPTSRFTLPMINKKVSYATNDAIYADPIYHKQVSDQNVIRPHYITQPVIRQVNMVQPMKQHQYIEQPIIQPVITQPVLRRHFIDQPYITNEMISQPVVQPFKTRQSFLRSKFTQAPHTEAQQLIEINEAPARAIIHQSTGAAREPIMLPLKVVQAQQQILQSPLKYTK